MSSALAIVILGALVYSNSFFCSFHFDDDAYIVNCFAIRNIHNFINIWNICPCRFITFLSLALNYHFDRLHVLGYHVFNLSIHIATALLVWWLCLLTFATPILKKEKISQHRQIISLLTALVFVSHPVQIEAVTYIWQRAASMAAFFYLASLCLYIKSRLLEYEKNKFDEIFYWLSLLTAALAMFTKENTITLPFMIFLYEWTFLKTSKQIDWLHLYPYWMALFIIPQTMVMTKTTRVGEIQSIVGGVGGISPLDYLCTQCRVMITYIRLCVLPVHLNLDYDYPVYRSFFEIPVIASLAGLGAIGFFAKKLFAKYKVLSFAISFFFLTLLPESSILPQTDVIFEHRLYLPLVGYCLFLVCGIFYLIDRQRSFGSLKVTIGILSLLMVVNSVLTYERNEIWKNELTLWTDTVQKSPRKARPYINRGWAYFNAGQWPQAMQDFNHAIAISPQLIYPYDDKGLIYAKQGKLDEAIAQYNQSIQVNPYFVKVYYHRGLAFLAQKNTSNALLDFNKAIELDPEDVDVYIDRSKLFLNQGDKARAKLDRSKAFEIDPGSSVAF